jgi:hypothetical protein
MSPSTYWLIRRILAGSFFGFGTVLVMRNNPALAGAAIMISVSIWVGAWIIGYNINKK